MRELLICLFVEGELYSEMEKFMDSNKIDNENEFDKEIEELKEWQDNQFNPGYYIGTGRVPKPISSLSKHPVILIVLGLICGIPFPVIALSGKASENWANLLISGVIPAIFIYGGVVRLIEKKRKGKQI